jgi:hypothetical protein
MLAELAELQEAVRWERECDAVSHWQYEEWEVAPFGSGYDAHYSHAVEIYDAARAAVDKLVGEG